MIVYHGSIQLVKDPDIRHSTRPLDFGGGFYVTTVWEQAKRWARRKADLFNSGKAIVNIYEMSAPASDLAFKDFGEDLEEWIDFVCDCRDGGEGYLAYVIVSKPL